MCRSSQRQTKTPSLAFFNKIGTGPGTFDAEQGGLAVHLEWGVLLADGQSTPARGWVRVGLAGRGHRERPCCHLGHP